MSEHLENRRWLSSRLRAEVIGPDPKGSLSSITPGANNVFMTWEEHKAPKFQSDGEEIISIDSPCKRYGSAILFPSGYLDEKETLRSDVDLKSDDDLTNFSGDPAYDKLADRLEGLQDSLSSSNGEVEDSGVSLANSYRPSAIGLSFVARVSAIEKSFFVHLLSVGRVDGSVVEERPCGRYVKATFKVGKTLGDASERSVWLRRPVVNANGLHPIVEVNVSDLRKNNGVLKYKISPEYFGGVDMVFELIVVERSGYEMIDHDASLFTVSLVNRSSASQGSIEDKCLFQAGLKIVADKDSASWILPYPDSGHDASQSYSSSDNDSSPLSDEAITALMYRKVHTFAIGHGAAADWAAGSPQTVDTIWTDCLPVFETSTISADLTFKDIDGEVRPLVASMRLLAGLDQKSDGFADLHRLLVAYQEWISELSTKVNSDTSIKSPRMQETARGLIERCNACLLRMRRGLELLESKTEQSQRVLLAFRLANEAMLSAQLQVGSGIRKPSNLDGKITWVPSYKRYDPSIQVDKKGFWRAFQIAFLLMSIEGIVDENSSDRDIVDLIWFPTGGGKTEAYLGLTAFTVFYNRLIGRSTTGSDVIMRYTLRLLTAQQFQRAATLFCAMEVIRNERVNLLGTQRFSIGLWVGGDTTPNKRAEAVSKLQALKNNPESENPFVLLKCPWCGASFGPNEYHGKDGSKGTASRRSKKLSTSLYGYESTSESPSSPKTVKYLCGDKSCHFGDASIGSKRFLPIVVIDEDLLESPPNLLIGTVDKFAMVAWKPEVRSIFGLNQDGKHGKYPPTLIIQDELHLISGPLGSMVGAYETVIEKLCTTQDARRLKPKIVASTATISRAQKQVQHLYSRDSVCLFPASGLDADDSFFSKVAKDSNGINLPGRLYHGVSAPAHGSLQTTEARVFATLMQNVALMKTTEVLKDPWWTLLCFFNSIRELGSAASLFVSDTREYLRVILERAGVDYSNIRQLFNVTELTSRIRGDQVPKELEKLEVSLKDIADRGDRSVNDGVVDACLASNIIEVGVDVPRLSLMAIVGQPKTTSQYIQVSSRVGRDLKKPGSVVVLYGNNKPRDRSHYERFRQYHQKLYAHVEPTSVTPFSAPAAERALHGLVVALVRQLAPLDSAAKSPDPFPLGEGKPLRDLVLSTILERVEKVSPEERDFVEELLHKRLREWQAREPIEYGDFRSPPTDAPLMFPAGSNDLPEWNGRSWPTMSSMRNVDASCEADVTDYYLQKELSDAETRS